MKPAGQQHMADLAAEERHRFRSLDREPHHRPGRAVDAARQIDRKDAGRSVHGLDHGARDAFDRAVETSPEQRIDDDLGRHQGGRCRGHAGTGPALRRQGCIPLEPLAIADQQQSYPVPALGQQAGGDEAIAPVVARPCHDGDARAGRMPRRDAVGDRLPGGFHQRDAGDPGRNRQAVGLGHLGGGEQLDHRRSKLLAQTNAVLKLAISRSIPLPAARDTRV